jgi:restriction endonuclease S subunit
METGARWRGLNVEDMGSVYILVPPINELNEIVRYLKESFSKINIAISIHRHQMLILITHRKLSKVVGNNLNKGSFK